MIGSTVLVVFALTWKEGFWPSIMLWTFLGSNIGRSSRLAGVLEGRCTPQSFMLFKHTSVR